MRGAFMILGQIVVAAVGLAAIGGLIGFLVVHFTHRGGAANGVGWGMIVLGGAAMLVVGGSGSPSGNFQRGRLYTRGLPAFNRPIATVPMPESPLQVAFGGALAFGLGVGVLVLFAY